MGWIEAFAEIRQVPRQAYTLKVGVERPLRYFVIGQRIQNLLRNPLPIGNVNDLHRTVVHGVSEEQDRKILRFSVTINTTLHDIHTAFCF